jgi:hypothetical protein
MSQRTFIEINHDRLYKISEDPKLFGKQLWTTLSSTHQGFRESFEQQYGIKIIGERHHSEPYALKVGGEIVAEEN